MSYSRVASVAHINGLPYVLERDALAVKVFHFRYKVVGRGPFPMDMLRYDQAYPADSTAANRMHVTAEDRDVVTVELCSNHVDRMWQPCYDRWKSFGWVVATTVWEG